MKNRSLFVTGLVAVSLLVLACNQIEQDLLSHAAAITKAIDTTVFAVNCGGSSYTSSDGTEFVADTGYSGGSTYPNTNSISVSFTLIMGIICISGDSIRFRIYLS